MNQRTCTIDGCTRPHRARGLCSTHYNQQHQDDRHRKVTVPCAYCGQPCEKEKAARRPRQFCSLTCRDAHRRLPDATVVLYRPRPVLYMFIDRASATPQYKPRTFVSGHCRSCGHDYVDRQTVAQFCSPLCARRWHREAWKERYGHTIPRAIRTLVYARDQHTCQLCFEPVDMTLTHPDLMSATLDHIICRSWTLVPDHSPSNLRLAHMICNSQRGNEAQRAS